jgi:hypothetical protein
MAKTKPRKNNDSEKRITMEIVVDAYGPEEQAMVGFLTSKRNCSFRLPLYAK